MVIKGTSKIKGVLDLSSVKLQITKGATYSLSDNDYWNSDVQSAIRMGFVATAGEPQNKSKNAAKVVRCINSYNRTISIGAIGKEVHPGHSFTLREDQLKDPDVKVALSRGMVTVVQIVDTSDQTEGFLELGNIFEKEEKSKQEDKKAEAEAFKKLRDQKVELETNESLPNMTKVINEENPPPVRNKDIDPRKRSIIWNPTGDNPVATIKGAVVATGQSTFAKVNSDGSQTTLGKNKKSSLLETAIRTSESVAEKKPPTEIVNAEEREIKDQKLDNDSDVHGTIPTNVIDTEYPAPVNPIQDDPKKNTIIVNPHSNAVTNTSKESVVWLGDQAVRPGQRGKVEEPKLTKLSAQEVDELLFVDGEAKKEQFQNHPKLGQQDFPEPDGGPDMVDQLDENSDAQRIAKHPVLGKKKQEAVADVVDMVDEDTDAQRIAKHPVLSKRRQNEELDV